METICLYIYHLLFTSRLLVLHMWSDAWWNNGPKTQRCVAWKDICDEWMTQLNNEAINSSWMFFSIHCHAIFKHGLWNSLSYEFITSLNYTMKMKLQISIRLPLYLVTCSLHVLKVLSPNHHEKKIKANNNECSCHKMTITSDYSKNVLIKKLWI